MQQRVMRRRALVSIRECAEDTSGESEATVQRRFTVRDKFLDASGYHVKCGDSFVVTLPIVEKYCM